MHRQLPAQADKRGRRPSPRFLLLGEQSFPTKPGEMPMGEGFLSVPVTKIFRDDASSATQFWRELFRHFPEPAAGVLG